MHRILAHWWVEVVAVAVVAAGSLLALAHMATTAWLDIMLYNGDSLVLPLVEKSLHLGQSFEWVFSSQLFLFPEGLLYGVATIFSDDPRVVLSLNLTLNLVALYALLRVAARLLAWRSRHRFLEIGVALIATGLFGTFVLLEPTPDVNRTAIASLFLISTYYYGAVLAAITLLDLVLWVTHAFDGGRRASRRRIIMFSVLATAVTLLATASNPLFLFVAVAPLVVTMVVLYFAARIDLRIGALVCASAVVGAVLGLLARLVLARFIARDVSNYLYLHGIPDSILLVWHSFVDMLSSPNGFLKLLIDGGLVVLSIGVLLYGLYSQARPHLANRLQTSEFFVVAFVSVSSVSLVVGTVITGAPTTRYLVGLFVFPLLTAVALGVHITDRLLRSVVDPVRRRSLARYSVGVVGFGCAVVLVFAGVSTPAVVGMIAGRGYAYDQCLDRFLGSSSRNGVGSFWSTRQLEVYGEGRGEILQVDPGTFRPYGWMIDLASYRDRDFDYVVVAGDGTLTASNLTRLGRPAKVVACPAYTIYDYRGTAGADRLSALVRNGLDDELTQRGYRSD